MNQRDEAREALEQIAATRRTAAHRAASPKGYYAVAGLGIGVVMLGLGLDNGLLRWALYALGLVATFGTMVWYSRHTGVVAWATLRERGAWRAWVMMLVSFAGLGVAMLGMPAAATAAVVTVVTWSVLGPAWDADWVRSIEGQP